MKVLKIIGIILAVLMLIILGVVLTLKGDSHMERSITMNAPAAKVFNVVNDFSTAKNWSPWFMVDPNTKYVFSEKTAGLGANYTWESENPDVGTGKQEIIEVKENELVNTLMTFGGMTGVYHAAFKLHKIDDNTTQVTWTLDSKADAIGEKFFIDYISDAMIGPVYDEGLQNLKAYVEGLPEPELLMEGMPMDSVEVE